MSEEKETQVSRREMRKKRRMRNQMIAYVTICSIVLLLIIGVIIAGRFVSQKISDKRQEVELAKELAAMSETQTAESETAETEESASVETYTQDDLIMEMVDACISEMTLEEKTAGLFLTTPESLTGAGSVVKAGEGTEKALSECAVGGLVYSGQNIKSEDQFSKMITDTMAKSKYPLFFLLPEESKTLDKDLSTYGINMEFEKSQDTDTEFTTVSLQSLAEGNTEAGLTTTEITGDAETIADACYEAWEKGTDLIYVPEHFKEAYEGMLQKLQADSSLEEKLNQSVERIYKVKYQFRLEE